MDLHKLRIFQTIARTGSFTRAAEQLFMTQPTVSQQLALLESELGSALIERRPRRQALTIAGQTLLPYAEQILKLVEEARTNTRAAAGLAERTLRLGVGHTLATYLLPDLLRRYRDSHPTYSVHISVGNSTELLDSIAASDIDVGLIGTPTEHPEINVTPFMDDRLVVIVAADDLWAERHSVALSELKLRTLLTREPGSALHAAVERLLGHQQNTIVLAETEAIKRCVEAGVGVALVQSIAVKRELAQGDLCALALQDADASRCYAYAMRHNWQVNAAVQALIALL